MKHVTDTHDNPLIKESKYIHKNNMIRKLACQLNNKQDQEKAFTILSILIHNGIQTYMMNEFDVIAQRDIIEKIFNRIILSNFGQEYHDLRVTNIQTNTFENTESKSITSVFDTRDIMCLIFQFLSCNLNPTGLGEGDIYTCSLVCSQWLYHAWNPNCISHVNLTYLLTKYQHHNINSSINSNTFRHKNNVYLQAWQRVCKARSVDFSCSKLNITDLLLSKLLMFDNIEKLQFYQIYPQIKIVKALVQGCENKIKHFNVRYGFYHDDNVYMKKKEKIQKRNDEQMTKLFNNAIKLSNVDTVYIDTIYFPIIWSNKCKNLILNDCENNISNNKWFNFIINNCDCSGIKHIQINDSGYGSEKKFTTSGKYTNALMVKFSRQFTSLTRLSVGLSYVNKMSLRLLCIFKYIINRNNGYIELNFESIKLNDVKIVLKLIRAFNNHRNMMSTIIINKIILKNTSNTKQFESQLKLIDWANLEYIQIKQEKYKKYQNMNDQFMLISLTHQLKEVFFGNAADPYWQLYFGDYNYTPALKVIDINCKILYSIGFVNELIQLILRIVVIRKRHICIKAHIWIFIRDCLESMFFWQFEMFCKNISKLVRTQRAWFDVRLCIDASKFHDHGIRQEYHRVLQQRYSAILDTKEIRRFNKCQDSYANKYYESNKAPVILFENGLLRAFNCTIS